MSQTFQVELPDGATLEGHLHGDGPAVVLISGLGGTAAFWKPVLPGLDGLSVVTFDQRGLGRSSRGTAPVTISQLAQDVKHLVDHLRLDHPVLVGHSTGGCIALEYALDNGQGLQALALSGTWCGPDPYMAGLFAMRMQALNANLALYESVGNFLAYPASWLVEHPALCAPSQSADSETTQAQRALTIRERIAALLAFDRRQELGHLSQLSTLVLGAKDDMVVPAHLQREIATALPSCELRLFETGGHFYPITRSGEFAKQLKAWIKGN